MPVLVSKYQKMVLHNQLKKVYSDLSEISKRFYVNEGISVTDYSIGKHPSDVQKYLFEEYTNGARLVDGTWKMNGLAGKYNNNMPPLRNITKKNIVGSTCDYGSVYKLPNGTYYVFDDSPWNGNEAGPYVCVDINGLKGPNAYGWDFFIFTFKNDGGIVPNVYNSGGVGNYSLLDNPSESCSSKSQLTCAYYALSDISPVDSSKSYWNDFLKF